MVLLRENLDRRLPDALVVADLLWYFVEGDPKQRCAPDVMVAFGRPKGHRHSYLQWEEGGVCPQVVFEVWSPKNGFAHRAAKLRLYDRLGVEEFYTWDPDAGDLAAFVRDDGALIPRDASEGFTSPRLGITLHEVHGQLSVAWTDGEVFRSFGELNAALEAERARADALLARLRAAGLDGP